MAKHVSVASPGVNGQALVRDDTLPSGYKFADIAFNSSVDLTTNQTISGEKNFAGSFIASGTFSAQTDMIPFPSLTYKFGDSTHYFTGIFAQRLTLNSTAYLDGSVAGVVSLVGGLKIATGASNGYLLTSDASGNASWQAKAQDYVDLTSAQTGIAGDKQFTGNLSQLNATPVFSYIGTSALNLATVGVKTYFNTSSFGNNAGVMLNVSVVGGSANATKFSIDQYSFSGGYVGNLMAIDINNKATSFNTTLYPANHNTQPIGLSTNYWQNLFATTLNINSTASISGSTAGVLQTVGDLRITTPGTNAGSVLTLAGTQTVTNKNLNSGTNTFPTFNQDTTGNAGSANGLKNATTVVLTSAAAAPSSGQYLVATSSTTATWQTLPSSMSATTYDPAAIAQQVVGLTATQTLTNKTLTAPVINNPTGFLTGAAKITVGTSAPSSPTTGDIWIDTN